MFGDRSEIKCDLCRKQMEPGDIRNWANLTLATYKTFDGFLLRDRQQMKVVRICPDHGSTPLKEITA